ncbi:MAG: Integrase [Acidimicrobiales bacterium]|nr:Integrase [Acidimicrobiales bacterium]
MSPRRRANGEGSVFWNDSRSRFEGFLDLGTGADGRRIRRKVVGKTRSEVTTRLADLRHQAERGLPLADGAMSVADLLDRWLSTAAAARVEPNTLDSYRWAARHLTRGLGTRRLAKLTPEDVEELLRIKSGTLGKASLIRVRSVLVQALTWAEKRGYVSRNVAALSELPSDARPPRSGRALTINEAGTFVAAAQGNQYFALWLTQLCLGLRPGEVAALQWSDIDLSGGVIHIRSSLRWSRQDHEDGPKIPTLVKTKGGPRGRRSLAAPPSMVHALIQHRERYEADVELRSPHWRDLVFANERGGPLDPANIRRQLGKVVLAGGLGHLRPYDLRHSAASLLAAAGVPIEVIADLLGHEGIRMARLVYVHAVSPTVDAAAGPMERLLGRS